MIIEIVKLVIYSILIVLIAKYVLVTLLRKLGEVINLKPDTIGNIAGIATSIPELLTVSISAFAGLSSTSAYNIISSNIINFVQYISAIYMNKNQKYFTNKAIRVDLILVITTIIIPILIIKTGINADIKLVPAFILLFILYCYISNNAHKLYVKKQIKIQKQKKREYKIGIIVKYTIFLILTGVLLYIIGNNLSSSLEKLNYIFKIPEYILGIFLGIVTSIPELITFIESQKHYSKNEQNDLGVIEATKNLLTSNILNLFIIQAIGICIYSLF